MKRNVILFRDPGEVAEDSSAPLPAGVASSSPAASSSSCDPYEHLLAGAGFVCTSIPVLKYDFINLDQLAQEMADHDKFDGRAQH